MSKHFEEVIEQIYELTRAEQLALIALIAESIGEAESESIPEAVIHENRRRLAAFDSGEVTGIPYREAMHQIRMQWNERR